MTEPEAATNDAGARQDPGAPEEAAEPEERWKAVARAEGRRFWTPRARRLGIYAAVLLEGLILLALLYVSVAPSGTPQREGLLFVCFHGLCHVGLWGSAWIGADLLSRQRADNPDPLRDPPPVEVLAGLFGRLAPFYWGYLLVLLTFTGACGFGAIDPLVLEEQLGGGFYDGMPAPRLLQWAGWSLAIFSGSLAYGLLSSLFSAWFRRPWRLLVTTSTLVLGTGVLAGVMLLLLRLGKFGSVLFAALAEGYAQFAIVLVVNPLAVGLFWAHEVHLKFQHERTTLWKEVDLSLRTCLFYLFASIVCGLILAWIATRRYARTSYNREAWERGE